MRATIYYIFNEKDVTYTVNSSLEGKKRQFLKITYATAIPFNTNDVSSMLPKVTPIKKERV